MESGEGYEERDSERMKYTDRWRKTDNKKEKKSAMVKIQCIIVD